MPTLSLGGKVIATQTGSAEPVLADNVVYAKATKAIVKIEQTVKNNRFLAAAATTEQIITDFNCSITPSLANSKILVQYSFDTSSDSTLTAYTYIERKIGTGAYAKLSGMMGEDTGSSNNSPALSHGGGGQYNWMCYKHAGMYQDTPSYTLGEQITYRIGLLSESTSQTISFGVSRLQVLSFSSKSSILLCLKI